MLDGLERADGAAKGKALQGIVAAHLQRLIGPADLFKAGQDRGAVQRLFVKTPAIARCTDQFGRCVLKGDLGLAARWIDRVQHGALDAGLVKIHQIERQTLRILTRRMAGQDDGNVSNIAVQYGRLGSRQGSSLGRQGDG